MTESEPSREDELAVLHGLTDWRVDLSAEQVIAVADMTYHQRAALLAELIAVAHANANALDAERARNKEGD